MRTPRIVAALAAAPLLLLAACGGEEPTAAEFTGTVLSNPFVAGDVELTETTGEPFSLVQDTDKDLTLVFYGYTNCPDICGQVMATLAGTMTRLTDEQRDRLDVVFVTTDPSRDTAEVVGDYVSGYDESFRGVTGDLDDIIALGRTMGVAVEMGEKLPSGGYDVTHGTRIMGLDGADEVPVMWSEQVSQAQLTTDITTLLAEED